MENCNAKMSVFCTIGQTIKSVKPILESKFQENGLEINLSQFIILNILNHSVDLILEDISKRLHTDKSAVLRHIKPLEQRFLIAKMTDSKDKRRKVLMLTQEGIKLLKRARDVEQELQVLLIKDINADDLEVFNNVLSKIKEQSMMLSS